MRLKLIIVFLCVAALGNAQHLRYNSIRSTDRQGTGTKFQMFGSGTPSAGQVATYDANGNLVPSTSTTVFGSQTANYFLAAPNGTAGVPTFRAMVAADVPILNQNTTGTAAGLTAQYIDWSASSGGSSIANKPTLGTAAAATLGTGAGQVPITGDYQVADVDLTALAGLSLTRGGLIYGSGVTPAYTILAAGTEGYLFIMGAAEPAWTAVPTWNQSTTGNAATATALASNPSDCGAGEFANAIAANGNLTCAVPAGGGTVLDLAVTKTAATELTIAAGNARFGSTVYTFAAATATITAGTGTAYVYVAADGTLTVAHDVTVTCSGCTQTSGTAFPTDSIPLYTWTATATVWDTAGGVDFRAALSTKKVAAGTGIQVSEAAGHATVAIDSSVVPTLTSTSTLTGKTIDAEGTGNVITTVSKIWFQAVNCDGTTASLNWDTIATLAPVPGCSAGTTNTGLIRGTAPFLKTEIDQMQTHFMLPSDWTGAIDLTFKWQTSATSGSVVWQAATVCVADAEVNDAAWNTASTVTDAAKGTTLQTNDASITGLTATGCAAGELLHLKVFRDPDHASDDLDEAAGLIGVMATLRRAQ